MYSRTMSAIQYKDLARTYNYRVLLKYMKNNKAARQDRITAELLKYEGETLPLEVHRLQTCLHEFQWNFFLECCLQGDDPEYM